MPLKTFIIEENLRNELAERFLLFKDRYHHQVFLDLKKWLSSDWAKDIKILSKKFKIDNDNIEFAKLQNSKSILDITLVDNDDKIVSSRHRESINISPSVKIPLLLKQEERDLIIKSLLNKSEDTIKDVTNQWNEIFRVEKKGRATPWFKIIRDKDEVRFQLALSDSDKEMYKTLYAIRVEYGKQGSKTKDFDRLYLISLINS